MAEPLSEFARRFILDPSRRKELDVPVLLWESPTLVPGAEKTLDLTWSSPSAGRLASGEPVVCPLRKGGSPTNAFVMGVTVGRTDNNDVVLNDPSVSRFHAYFIRDPRKREIWRLVDADSKNGTWVGPMKLQSNAGVEVHDRAHLRFGDIEMDLLWPESFFKFIQR
ncbi:MAG TPA: FHA domain-containing protein [Myxococcales bacterium]|nr:FHA domain-containing protein [Myxococcales bacterium]